MASLGSVPTILWNDEILAKLAASSSSTHLSGFTLCQDANVRENSTASKLSALKIEGGTNFGTGSITNTFGIHVSASTLGTNNYGGYFSGYVGVGTEAPLSWLHATGSSSTSVVGLTVENSVQAVASTTTETVQIRFAMNGVADSGRIVLGKDADFTSTANKDSFMAFYTCTNATATEYMRLSSAGYLGIGITAPTSILHVAESTSAAGGITSGTTAMLTSAPTYTVSGTVTRHNYIKLANVALSGTAACTNACAIFFDAAAGTHKAVDSGSTKTTPGGVDAWVKVNVNGTVLYMPCYTSKTA